MPEYLTERTLRLSVRMDSPSPLQDTEAGALRQLESGEIPVRFAVTESQGEHWYCDAGIYVGSTMPESIFRFEQRTHEDTGTFNVVMLVPTGIGADIGGHAGDAAPAAALLANVCDSLITHPNVFNASDLIQVPQNALYVEGSVITRMMMGTARLMPARSNRVLVLIQSHADQIFTDAAINSVNAARAYYGLEVTEVVTISPAFKMIAEYSPSGAAAGRVEGLEHIWEAIDARLGRFDAVAVSSVIEVPAEFHQDYYEHQGAMVNPWGGVEAMLTHAISLKYGLPAAHAPMFESREVADLALGVVDPRMAAEVVSVTFLQSVLRGLQHSPRIVKSESLVGNSLGVEAISCMVIPYACLGLPTLAALQQDIPVIVVGENCNIMRNHLDDLAWRDGQLIPVKNYWEAAGVLVALRMGLDPYSVRRPLGKAEVTSQVTESATAAPTAWLLPPV